MLSDKKRQELKCKYRILNRANANGGATGTEISQASNSFKSRLKKSCLQNLLDTGCIDKRTLDSLGLGRKTTLFSITAKGKAEIELIEEVFNNG